MSLRICEVTADNWQTIALLSVEGSQESYIEPNALSIAQSRFEPQWKSVGLYDGDTAVGYAMYGLDISNGDVWLDRFMIDKDHQGKGYAKKFLSILIKHLQETYQRDTVYLSICPENKVAQQLYEHFGFRLNGEIDNTGVISGLIMVLDSDGRCSTNNDAIH
ncbi:GNAT family N-acetyltransferase [Bacillus massiliigorillae]|uniref:GNAT family N-acetyltransferase n=1 Tax=Bacillus massiliigorillae TaxID=1243664 RepID=UPI0003A6C4AF|nr:GNAT family N-acetyltransferase [Bacillus massiliigorillae]